MSMFKVNVVVRNTKDESLIAPPMEVLVDTGSELTWLPKDLLIGIKVSPLRKRSFSTATKQLVTRDTGYAIVSAEGFETVDEVVFAEAGDMALLGVRTLEGFGVMVDNIGHRFVATTTIVAIAGRLLAAHQPGRQKQQTRSGPLDIEEFNAIIYQ
jgi:predicted aspartyl protease